MNLILFRIKIKVNLKIWFWLLNENKFTKKSDIFWRRNSTFMPQGCLKMFNWVKHKNVIKVNNRTFFHYSWIILLLSSKACLLVFHDHPHSRTLTSHQTQVNIISTTTKKKTTLLKNSPTAQAFSATMIKIKPPQKLMPHGQGNGQRVVEQRNGLSTGWSS